MNLKGSELATLSIVVHSSGVGTMPAPADSIRAALRENMQLEMRARALRQAINLAADPAAAAARFRTELTEIETKLIELQAKTITDGSSDKDALKEKPSKTKARTRGGTAPSAFEIASPTKGPGLEAIAKGAASGRTVGELARGIGIRPEAMTRSVRSTSGISKLGA